MPQEADIHALLSGKHFPLPDLSNAKTIASQAFRARLLRTEPCRLLYALNRSRNEAPPCRRHGCGLPALRVPRFRDRSICRLRRRRDPRDRES